MLAEEAGLADRTTQPDGFTPDTGLVDMGFHYPINAWAVAVIDSISPNPAVQGKDTIGFQGHGEDSDGTIVAYEWSSDVAGILSSEASFAREAALLDMGVHTVSFRVCDNSGVWSAPTTQKLVVTDELRDMIGGTIESDLTISGKIDVVSDIIVEPAATLTIEPGTQLRIGRTLKIEVHGGLLALGTVDAPIFFDPFGSDAWRGVVFEEDSETDSCEMSFCSVQGAGFDHHAAIHCNQSSPRIQNCIISNNTWDGIECSGSCYPIIADNVIANSGDDGIDCSCDGSTILHNLISGNNRGVMCFYSDAEVLDNYISDNSYGIECRCETVPNISGNVITNSAWSGIYCLYCSPRIHNNLIIGNADVMLRGSGITVEECAPVINSCTVTLNSPGIETTGYWESSYASPAITDCIIWGNGCELSFVWGSSPSVSYSVIEGGCPGNFNRSWDPRFVTGPLGEYYLHPESPCIDSGSKSAAAAGVSDRTTQADGTPDTGTVDTGFHYAISAD